MKKVVKFGGSSLANAEQFQKVGEIIKSDKSRRYVVPSAPGKRFDGDTKVTDMLYGCYETAASGEDFTNQLIKALQELKAIRERYYEIVRGLNLNLSLEKEFKTIQEDFKNQSGVEYAASRGEFLNGKIMAAYLGYTFVDAAEVIRFRKDGSFDMEATDKLLTKRLEKCECAVIPGFYGACADGTVRTFSRGGSDVTGSLVAKAIQADLYENWTDVSGILMADPRIVENPRPIPRITYAELREMAFMGASVLHEESILPVKEKGISLNIRNTNQPDNPGTMIRESFDETEQLDHRFITGIAGRKHFSVITITKTGMSSENGSLRRILEVLERYGVNVEYLPSGIDNVSLVVSAEKAAPCMYQLLGELQKEIKPDAIHVTENIAIVAAVGRKMAYQPGSSGKIFATLGENGINIRMITQGPEELNIIVGVDDADFAPAIRVLYDSFVK